jgi:hypothetical protein
MSARGWVTTCWREQSGGDDGESAGWPVFSGGTIPSTSMFAPSRSHSSTSRTDSTITSQQMHLGPYSGDSIGRHLIFPSSSMLPSVRAGGGNRRCGGTVTIITAQAGPGRPRAEDTVASTLRLSSFLHPRLGSATQLPLPPCLWVSTFARTSTENA